MKKGCEDSEWDRAARLGSRKLKKVGRVSTLVKKFSQKPRIRHRAGKRQSSVIRSTSLGTRHTAVWGLGLGSEVVGGV